MPQAAWHEVVRSAGTGLSAALGNVLDGMVAEAHAQGLQTHAHFAAEESGTLGAAWDPWHEGRLDLIVEISNRWWCC